MSWRGSADVCSYSARRKARMTCARWSFRSSNVDYQSRREYRRTCEVAGKSGKQIERCVISSFQIAESMGFKGEFRQWEHLSRTGD